MLNPFSYFQPLLLNKGRGMCYPVCGMVHIKDPLLLNGDSAFPLSLSEWFFTIRLVRYNRKIKSVVCIIN